MGRRSHSRALDVWSNGLRVARWLLPRSGPTELTYEEEWVASDQGRPLSLSLPIALDGLPIKGERVEFFFDNLLPDSEPIRRRIRDRFGARSGSAFDLLEAIGRDCVGAIQLLPSGEPPTGVRTIAATPLAASEIERVLIEVTSSARMLGEEQEDFRISLAGAQEKTAFIWHNEHWCKPHGSTPTTHIFKLPLGVVGGRKLDLTTSLENEWLCSRLLAAFGIPVADARLERFGDTKALVVKRFDRELAPSKKHWLRLPQEDFCQATGTPPSRKYESDGGPDIITLANILRGSEEREADLTTLLRAQLLFYLLAATDGHAKNFSLHLLAQGRYRLTPLYDVISAWPVSGSRSNQIHPSKLKLAMSVRGKHKHYDLALISREHFNTTARACGFGPNMNDVIDRTIERAASAIAEVSANLPDGFPDKIFDSVSAGIHKGIRSLTA